MTADFSIEKKYWESGTKVVAGADEVGRGSFAGPVVAAVVVLPRTIPLVKIDDSKKLSPRERNEAYQWIQENALFWSVAESSSTLINKIGINIATQSAFRRAIETIARDIEILLVDGFKIPNVANIPPNRQEGIIRGDQKSLNIAAASIVAKVHRDALMVRLHEQHSVYGWKNNKGYGTKVHTDAIKTHGITPYHRTQFVETYLSNNSNKKI